MTVFNRKSTLLVTRCTLCSLVSAQRRVYFFSLRHRVHIRAELSPLSLSLSLFVDVVRHVRRISAFPRRPYVPLSSLRIKRAMLIRSRDGYE